MPTFKYFLYPVLVFSTPVVTGQTLVRLTDPKALVTDINFNNDRSAVANMQAAGLDEAAMETVRATELLPPGLQSDSARTANGGAIPNYVAYRLCDVALEEKGVVGLVRIPARENFHMPEGLRSNTDLYLFVRHEGLAEVDLSALRAKPSKGPRWQGRPEARIVKADGLYATYDLAADRAAMDALERSGMNVAEIEAVVFRSHQRNWPSGMDEVQPRIARNKDLKRYKAVEAVRWENKVLLIIPAELNRKMPEAIRPYHDIYMVYQADAVAVKGRR